MADSEQILSLLKQAEEARQTGDLDKAVSLCLQAITADSRSVPAYTKLAELYVSKNDPAKAAEQYLFIAKAYHDSKLLKGALKHYQKVLELDESCLEARVKLSEIYEAEGMEREAKLETFKVAEIYYEKGDMVQAESFAIKAVALKSIEARYTVGLIHLKRDMVKEAIGEFEQLVKFKPNHLGAFVTLGQAYLKMNRPADAVTALEKAKKLKPDDLPVLEQLAASLQAKNTPIDALAAYVEAAEASGKQADLERLGRLSKKLIELAAQFQKAKDVERARTIYQKILTWDPENPEVKTHLGQLSAAPEPVASPKVESPAAKSLPASAPAATVTKTPELVVAPTGGPLLKESGDMLAEADGLINNGQYQEAINIYRMLVKKHPDNTVIRQKLHQAYLLAAQEETPGGAPAAKATPAPTKIEPVTKKKGLKVSYL